MQEVIKSQDWPYDKWWNDLTEQLSDDIVLPTDLSEPKSQRRAINALHKDLKDIEVVSVVLRFWCPKEFGIISPPVVWLLSLAPSRYRVKDYLHYLDNLKDLAEKHDFQRLADVDMALWSAAHLHNNAKYGDWAAEMHVDLHFRQLRLTNLLRGLGEGWRGTAKQQFLLAKTLLVHDHFTAALIASRAFEWVVSEIATKHFGIPRCKRIGKLKFYVGELTNRLLFLDHFAQIIKLPDDIRDARRHRVRLGPRAAVDLRILQVIRNDAVHYDEVNAEEVNIEAQKEELKKTEAKAFIENIERLFLWLDRQST